MQTELACELQSLAEKYETKGFLDGDPSQFMHLVEGDSNRELLAFVASCLSYGSRKQFLPKIERVLRWSQGDVVGWIKGGRYAADIPDNGECYYRLYTNSVMLRLLNALREMLELHGSMRGFVENIRKEGGVDSKLPAISVVDALVGFFSEREIEGIVPKSTASSCKRICMFLRWMVRDSSPVDIGLWSDLIDKRTLIMPLDTHVMQEARRLGLIASGSASMATARKLTERLRQIFPDDPLKGDFALFGVGVN